MRGGDRVTAPSAKKFEVHTVAAVSSGGERAKGGENGLIHPIYGGVIPRLVTASGVNQPRGPQGGPLNIVTQFSHPPHL